MMMEEVDLGLSLGLGGASESQRHSRIPSPQLNLRSSSLAAPSPSPLVAHGRAPAAGLQWCDLLAPSSSTAGRSLARSPFLQRIDVNLVPAANRETEDDDEEAAVSSPNSTVSSAVSGGGAGSNKRGERHHQTPGHQGPNSSVGDDNELERAFSRGISDEEDGGEGSRKKLRLSKEQSAVLEESFKENHTLNPKQKLALAKQLNLRPRQVEVWFQNRRARTKLKQTEVDCELLRRCCEGLAEENRRLQKEVQELRALKLLNPQLYMQVAPPTTLTMCPSCERLAAKPNSAAAATAASASPTGPVPGPTAADGHRHQQFPQHWLQSHHPLPRHHLVAQRSSFPVASAGVTAVETSKRGIFLNRF